MSGHLQVHTTHYALQFKLPKMRKLDFWRLLIQALSAVQIDIFNSRTPQANSIFNFEVTKLTEFHQIKGTVPCIYMTHSVV